MEEDIKIIEDYIKSSREFEKEVSLEEIFEGIQWKRRIKALENLLKRYKELEEKNIEILQELLTERVTNKVISNNIINYQEELKNSIPISVIQNKRNEYLDFDKKYKTYTKDGRENFTMEYFKAKALDEILDLKE